MILRLLFLLLVFSQALFSSVVVLDSFESVAEKAARRIADLILSKKGEKVVLGLATGATMIPVYRELRRIVQVEKIDFSEVITFNLDEYMDLPASSSQSYASFMYEHLFNELLSYGLKEENIHIPSLDLWTTYEEQIKIKGPIDLQLLGIGRNGHIGFAEPGVSHLSRTFIVELADSTRIDNAHFFDGKLELVPKHAITMGIATILEAKEILLLAFGKNKAKAIANAIQEEPSSMVPATFLQNHPKVDFYLDTEAAALLQI